MQDESMSRRPGQLRTRTVHGTAYDIAGRRLTPVAKIVSYGEARGTVKSGSLSGRGGGFVCVTPVAVLEESAGSVRTISLRNPEASLTGRLVLVGLAVFVVLVCVRRLAGRRG